MSRQSGDGHSLSRTRIARHFTVHFFHCEIWFVLCALCLIFLYVKAFSRATLPLGNFSAHAQVALFAVLQAWNWVIAQCSKKEAEKVDMKDICPECVDGVCPMPAKAGKTDISAAVASADDDVQDDADSVVTAASEPDSAAVGTKKSN